MDILFFCPRWGSDAFSWELFLSRVVEVGYDGVEIGLPEDLKEAEALIRLIEAHGLKYIIQHYETHSPDFSTHQLQYVSHLERMAAQNPFLVNSHTGRDFFSFQQNTKLLERAEEIASKNNTIITHETHRSRFSFAAHVTEKYLQYDWLKLTLDISHWFCVAETLLEDQEAVLVKTIPHVQHIHARIGHTQGPQVANPEGKEWTDTCERHFQLWDNVLTYHRHIGTKVFGITTEFGPWPYMPVLPLNKASHIHQFELNINMLERLKARINSKNNQL